MITDEDVEKVLEHHGVKGQKWGIRRDPKTGVRPSAKALNDSAFGKLSKKNVARYNAKKSRKSAAQKRKDVQKVHRVVKITAGALFLASLLAANGDSPSRQMSPSEHMLKSKSNKPNKSTRSLADTLRMQEAQRNGAFQIKKMLKDMGEDVA